MQERIDQEIALLRSRCSDLEYEKNGQWVRIPAYSTGDGWNRAETEVAFQIRNGFPGTPPYGFYVPTGIRFNGAMPGSYTEPAPNQPPFPGTWAAFSWAHTDDWRPTSDPRTGSNLLNWVIGFSQRFREGA